MYIFWGIIASGILCFIWGWFVHENWAYQKTPQVQCICYAGKKEYIEHRFFPIKVLVREKKILMKNKEGRPDELRDLCNLREFETLLNEKIKKAHFVCIKTLQRQYHHKNNTMKPIYEELILSVDSICCLGEPFADA